MSKKKTPSNSGKRKRGKGSVPNRDSQLAAGGELHQVAGGDHPALTTNQGVAFSDNQNLLRANSRGPTLLAEHRPMGGINRLRQAVYLARQAKRAAKSLL